MRDSTTRGKRATKICLVLAVVVAALVLLVSGSALASPPWSDAPNSWWISSYGINESQAAMVADGWPDGTFRPGLDVTRAQFAKMAVAGLGVATASPFTPTFPDVPPANFFYPWIEGGVSAGLIAGLADGTFGPDQTIIRQQANSILGNYLAQKELTLRGHIAGKTANYPTLNTWYLAEGATILTQFADANRVASVHAPATAYLVYRAIVQGSYNNGWLYLGPGLDLTRAQAVALILRVKSVTFSTALPTISGLNPSSGLPSGGNSVVITGTNFTEVFAVRFGTANATFTVNSATQITAVAPTGTLGSTVDVKVETAAGISIASTASKYTYGLPTLTGLNPASGPTQGGNTVIITGTNLTGATAVKFGTKAASSFSVTSNTQITAVAPSGSGTVDVTVTAPGGTTATSTASKYSYGVPTVTGLTPTTGPAVGGTSVTITGTGFTGVSAVKFGAKNATSFVVNSPTSITAVAPAAVVGTVDVTVATAAGTSPTGSTSKYAYTGPVITLLTPASGPTTGGNTVVITGTGFTNATLVTFGAKSATFIVDSSTKIRAIAPSSGTNGVVDVAVTTSSGTSATSDATKYTYGVPVITKLDPSWGPADGGNIVAVEGSGFFNVTSVKFGADSATFHVYSSTLLTAVAPGGINGATVQVTVTANGETSSTTGTANDYTYGAAKFVITRSGTTTPLTGLIRTAGVPLGIRVTAQDPSGNVIDNFDGVVTLTSNSWAGPVTVNMNHGIEDNVVVTPKIVGTARNITVTYGTIVTTNASGNFTVVPGTVQKLQILLPGETAAPGTVSGKTGSPTNQASGAAFNVVVNAVDAYWNVVTTVTDMVRLTSTDGAAGLPGDTALVAGTKTLSVTLNTSGLRTITASDVTHASVDPVTSASVLVVGAFTKLQILVPGETAAPGTVSGKTGTPSARVAGTSFTVRVNAVDANWNVVPGATDMIHLASTDPAAVIPIDAALVNGTRTFTVALRTTGTWTITASDATNGAITPDTSPGILVNVGALGSFEFTAIANQVAGTAFGFTISALDVAGNLKTDFIGSVSLHDSTGTLTPTTSGAFLGGQKTISTAVITEAGTNIAITATSGAISGDSSPFDVAAGDPAKVIDRAWRITGSGEPGWTLIDPASALANGATIDFRMRVLDQYDNWVTARDISAFHPWYRWVGPAVGGRAPVSSTTDTSGFVYWNGEGGATDATYALWLGLDFNGDELVSVGEPWDFFDITWGTPGP
jgi:hypothetical protein